MNQRSSYGDPRFAPARFNDQDGTFDPDPNEMPGKPWFLAYGAEADLDDVALGDFSGLSQPLLVACACDSQFEDFCWREALICTEIERIEKVRPAQIDSFPKGKILLLLPGWHLDRRVEKLVSSWVDREGYTVALDSPRHGKTAGGSLFFLWYLLGLIALVLIAWTIFRQ